MQDRSIKKREQEGRGGWKDQGPESQKYLTNKNPRHLRLFHEIGLRKKVKVAMIKIKAPPVRRWDSEN
jgi:hypothetical protein